MNKPVFTGPNALRAAMAHILSTIPQGERRGDIPLPFAELSPNVKVRRIVVPEGSDITEVIAKAVADIRAEVNAERASEQNGVNAVSVDTACECPACAQTQVADEDNSASEVPTEDHPLTKIFRARVKRLVEAFVTLAFPEVEVWTEESDFGQTDSYTFNLVVTGVESLDETETILVTVPNHLMDATNLELVGALTGVLNYVGASISALVD